MDIYKEVTDRIVAEMEKGIMTKDSLSAPLSQPCDFIIL